MDFIKIIFFLGVCDIGYYDNGGCTPCQNNSYKDTVGPNSCQLCLNNKITSGTGMTSSSDCCKYFSNRK